MWISYLHTVETARVIQTEKLDTTQQMYKTKKVDEKIDATQLYFTKFVIYLTNIHTRTYSAQVEKKYNEKSSSTSTANTK